MNGLEWIRWTHLTHSRQPSPHQIQPLSYSPIPLLVVAATVIIRLLSEFLL